MQPRSSSNFRSNKIFIRPTLAATHWNFPFRGHLFPLQTAFQLHRFWKVLRLSPYDITSYLYLARSGASRRYFAIYPNNVLLMYHNNIFVRYGNSPETEMCSCISKTAAHLRFPNNWFLSLALFPIQRPGWQFVRRTGRTEPRPESSR